MTSAQATSPATARTYHLFYYATAALLAIRWLLVPALPLGNDEAYYWDWGRELALSYFDHPPGVSWLAFAAGLIDDAARGGRWLVPLLHAAGCCVQLAILKRLTAITASRAPTASKVVTLFILAQLVPYSFIGGLLLMPDAGLLLLLPVLALVTIELSQTSPEQRLPLPGVAVLGLTLGLAFNFKYHGLVIGGCGILWLLWQRRLQFFRDLPGWLLAFGLFCAAAYPVLAWNIANDFISFRFQTDHGFGGLSFKLTPLIQLIVADIVLLSPLMIYLLFRSGAKIWRGPASALAAMGLPLLLLILGLAPFKEVLPHWLVPCFWVLLPVLALPAVSRGWQIATAIYSAIIVIALLLVAIHPAVQRFAFAQSRNKPSGLGELTVWPYIGEQLAALNYREPVSFHGGDSLDFPACAQPKAKLPVIASVRWYQAAQLAATLPGRPKVISLDPSHLSYYHFRDNLADYKGCPVVVIGQTKHTNLHKLANPGAGNTIADAAVTAIRHEVFTPRYHRDREILVVWGILN